MNTHDIIIKSFKLLQSSDLETVNLGFTVLEQNWHIVCKNSYYYNKLLKHINLLPSRGKSNNIEIVNKHIEWCEKLTNYKIIGRVWSGAYFNHMLNLFIKYFKEVNNENQ